MRDNKVMYVRVYLFLYNREMTLFYKVRSVSLTYYVKYQTVYILNKHTLLSYYRV